MQILVVWFFLQTSVVNVVGLLLRAESYDVKHFVEHVCRTWVFELFSKCE